MEELVRRKSFHQREMVACSVSDVVQVLLDYLVIRRNELPFDYFLSLHEEEHTEYGEREYDDCKRIKDDLMIYLHLLSINSSSRVSIPPGANAVNAPYFKTFYARRPLN